MNTILLTILAGTHMAQAALPGWIDLTVEPPRLVPIQWYGSPPPGYYNPPPPRFYPRGEGAWSPYPQYMPRGDYMRPDDWQMMRRGEFGLQRRYYGPPMGW